jgi:hypothetical protein
MYPSERGVLRQPRDVDGDPPRLVLREHLCLPRFGVVVARIEVSEGLSVGQRGYVIEGETAG